MSNGSPAPGRLDSLKGKRTGLGSGKPTPGLKFKPKAVARRTKEERDADAPVVVPETAPPPTRNNLRGRGGARGGRGRGNMNRTAGTHLVSSGPLSSGFISMENNKSSSRVSASPTPDFVKNLKNMSRSMSPGLSGSSSDDESSIVDGDTKINMSKQYVFDDELTELFPVRALRTDEKRYGESLPTLPTTKQEDGNLELTPEPTVKSENEDDVNIVIPPSEKAREETPQPTVTNEDEDDSNREKARLVEDFDKLKLILGDKEETAVDNEGDVDMESKTADSTTSLGKSLDGGFIFFQLPKLLPEFKTQQEALDLKKKKKPEEKAQEIEERDYNQPLNGQVGSLRYHKSGKISMKLGNIEFDVTRGGPSDFLQELVHIENGDSNASKPPKDEDGDVDIDEEEQHNEPAIHHVGQILEKIVVTPKVDGSLI